MMRIVHFAFLLLLTFAMTGQQHVRSYDGTGNNLLLPSLGAANTPLTRLSPAMYADGIGQPMARMNPREISNRLFDQTGLLNDDRGLSAFVWVFGQFIDHDISLVHNDENEFLPILLPENDVLGSIIPFTRSSIDPTSGDDSPREHMNSISAFIDGSAIYGSSLATADWLRSHEGGKLKTSVNNLLPFGTTDGNHNSPRDARAPEMADDTRSNQKLFVAGDIRANENLYLLTMHTLFVREHNRLADQIAARNPNWEDEEIFQKARQLVVGMMQQITFEEWLPAMGIHLKEYDGYNEVIDPSISNEFSAAAFRMGHTLLNSHLLRVDNYGQEIPQGHIRLKDAYFSPLELITGGGIDPLLKGMATQQQQEFDCKVVEDVRNFLFGAVGYGGLDLAAINIFRGRERGLPDYNTIRKDIGLGAVTSFDQISSRVNEMALLEEMYGTVDNIDAWVGMLAEDHMDDKLFGATVNRILELQFLALRDGDRFYFDNDSEISEENRQMIKQTTLAELIKRNTEIELLQKNVFRATPHHQIYDGPKPSKNDLLTISAYPAPFDREVHIRLESSVQEKVKIQLINSLGQLAAERSYEVVEGIQHVYLSDLQKLTRGYYTLFIQINGEYVQQKLLKI